MPCLRKGYWFALEDFYVFYSGNNVQLTINKQAKTTQPESPTHQALNATNKASIFD
ncbi:hypothetical protein GCM10028773_00940 [Spirosoma koreense]